VHSAAPLPTTSSNGATALATAVAVPAPSVAASNSAAIVGKGVACGAVRCAEREACCDTHQDVCIAVPRQGHFGQPETQRCSLIAGSYEFTVNACDSSSGCPANELCCNQNFMSGVYARECVTKSPRGGSPCDFGEACVQTSDCKLAGTTCIEGVCQKGKAGALKCTAAKDCQRGEVCVVNGAATQCISKQAADTYALQGGLGQTCQVAADCPLGCMMPPTMQGVRMLCTPSAVPGIKSCSCP
jgi:hypothetical protein